MKNIYFLSHLIHQSKYKIFINFLIYVIIYTLISNSQLAYCMTEGTEISEIAEAKEVPSHQVRALKKEITDFAGSYAHLQEYINEQTQEIKNLKEALNKAEAKIQLHENFITQKCIEQNELIREHNQRIRQITDSPYIKDKQKLLNMIAAMSYEEYERDISAGRIIERETYYKDY